MSADAIILGGGCFWCLEAVYLGLEGVTQVISGYAGGHKDNPTYEQVCTGRTGHAEVVQVAFDPDVTSLEEVMSVFFAIHDPTTLNRQGADVGTQYRSVIFYRGDTQRATAQRVMDELAAQAIWPDPLVTELLPAPAFFAAEDYHQEYFFKNPDQGYCRAVVSPKVSKFREKFRHKLKPDVTR